MAAHIKQLLYVNNRNFNRVSKTITHEFGFGKCLIKQNNGRNIVLLQAPSIESQNRVTSRYIHQSQLQYKTSGQQRHKAEDSSVFGHLLLFIPVATFGLGTWQVKRRKWKLGLIKDLEKKTSSEPVPLPTDQDVLDELEYRRVFVRGHFDHSRELHVLPRSLYLSADLTKNTLPMAPSGDSGVNVITPFYCTDLDKWILVNRGWVSKKKTKPSLRAGGQIDGDIDLVGIVRRTEKRQPFMPDNDSRRNRWHYRDHDAMALIAGSEPILIDADYESTVPDGPIGGQTRVTLRNEHLQYAITWYSLCILTTLLWWFGIVKKKKSALFRS